MGNLNTVGIIFLFYLAQVLILFILMFITKCCKLFKVKLVRVESLNENMYQNLFFSAFISLFLEGYLEFLFCALLSKDHNLDTTPGEVFARILTYPMLAITLAIMPLLRLWTIYRTPEQITDPKFKLYWGSLFDGNRYATKG